MRSMQPFRQITQTHAIVASATPPTAIQLPQSSNAYDRCVISDAFFYNPSSSDVWVGLGATAAQALANTSIPTSGSPTNARVIPAMSYGVLDYPRDAFITARTASGTATIYVAAGIGL